jgi:hypothetical protein
MVKNTPAYYDAATITAVKSFIVLAQVAKTFNFLLSSTTLRKARVFVLNKTLI